MSTFTHFSAGSEGQWRIVTLNNVTGAPVEKASHLRIYERSHICSGSGIWTLRGFSSNIRYAEKDEKQQLQAKQEGLGRSEASFAALIPIKKNEEWWALAQDERRKIFEMSSKHTATGMRYLPAIARKLYHSRDINEPFDFLTWFEYAPEHAEAFEELVALLRKTEEWQYVERETDIRLEKTALENNRLYGQ